MMNRYKIWVGDFCHNDGYPETIRALTAYEAVEKVASKLNSETTITVQCIEDNYKAVYELRFERTLNIISSKH